MLAQLLVDWTHLILLTIALGVLLHEVGVLSLGHAGVLLTGAYAVALVDSSRLSLPQVVGTVLALLLVLATSALLVKDDLFAVLTLSFGEVLRLVALAAYDLTGGAAGLGPVSRSDWLASDWGALVVAGTGVAVASVVYVVGFSTWPALLCGATRDGELYVRGYGVSASWLRVTAVALSGGIAFCVGALQVLYFGLATPRMGILDVSLQAIAAALIAWPFWRHGRPLLTLVGFALGAGAVVALPVLLRQVLEANADVAVIRQALFGMLLFALVHPRCPLSKGFGRS